MLYLHRTKKTLLICWSLQSAWSCQEATCSVELLERLRCCRFSDFSLAETIFVSDSRWGGNPFTTYSKIVLPETEPFAIVSERKLLPWRNFPEVEEVSCSSWWVDDLGLEALTLWIIQTLIGQWSAVDYSHDFIQEGVQWLWGRIDSSFIIVENRSRLSMIVRMNECICSSHTPPQWLE